MAILADTQMIEYRKLGRSEIQVSLLGFGTAPLGEYSGQRTHPREGARSTLPSRVGSISSIPLPIIGSKLSEDRPWQALAGWRDKGCWQPSVAAIASVRLTSRLRG
jgi:hypothetical protein